MIAHFIPFFLLLKIELNRNWPRMEIR